MQYYPTPIDVVNILKKHLPRFLGDVLEPSAGEGALLESIESSSNQYKSLTLVDIDPNKCEILRVKHPAAKVQRKDFVTWELGDKRFDTVIANPPFHARPGKDTEYDGNFIPIEFAFVKKSISLLKEGGFFLAILPSSVIASDLGSELRSTILGMDVRYCYELPAYSFKGVEGGFFIIILRKAKGSGPIRLRLIEGGGRHTNLVLSRAEIITRKNRLDFSYHSTFFGSSNYFTDLEKFNLFEYSFRSVKRGSVRSGYKRNGVIHSTSFNNGFWSEYSGDESDYVISCQRVARSAHLSFGLLHKSLVGSCTDCVITFEVPEGLTLATLFYMRVMFSSERGRKYLLRGTGSKYMSLNDLRDIRLFDICKIFRTEFSSYKNHYIKSEYSEVIKIENMVRYRLLYGEGVSCLSGINLSNGSDTSSVSDRNILALQGR